MGISVKFRSDVEVALSRLGEAMGERALRAAAFEGADIIRNEVVQSLTQWREHEQLIELKRSAISSLEQSLARQEKLKDIETIRFDARVELEQQLQRERSNLVHELIAREISRIQFQQSLGQLDPVSSN